MGPAALQHEAACTSTLTLSDGACDILGPDQQCTLEAWSAHSCNQAQALRPSNLLSSVQEGSKASHISLADDVDFLLDGLHSEDSVADSAVAALQLVASSLTRGRLAEVRSAAPTFTWQASCCSLCRRA
jgi:hypothetical protein